MSKTRLTQQDWLAAGFRALAETGPGGLQINLLCTALGTTKGSFYWHFKDLPAYKAAMLDLWMTKVATEIIREVRTAPTTQARLHALLFEAARPAPPEFGGRTIEAAMRAWALSDGTVAAHLARIDQLRLEFVTQLLHDAGLTMPGLPDLVYGAYVGLDDLAARGNTDMASAMQALHALLTGEQPTQEPT